MIMPKTKSESQPASGSSKKRPASEDPPEEPSKITKVHPFFSKSIDSTSMGSFQWFKSLGPAKSCLHGANLSPKSLSKVAAFDLDGTVIKGTIGNRSAADAQRWEWWRPTVPSLLQELSETGFSIVIVSNQAVKPATLQAFKQKIPSIATAIPSVPFRIFAATAKDNFRKPMPGIWSELERIFREDGVEIDKAASFFVGDAAGRQYQGRKPDFAGTDRKWAANVRIPFFTPEEYFLKLPAHTTIVMDGFNVSSLPDLPIFTPTSSPLLPVPPKQELVLFVGYPCLGKSTIFRRYFQSPGYAHVNQDVLKTRDKCVKAAQEFLKDGRSCVVDNTNRDSKTRKFYIDIAKRLNIPVRCLVFTGSIELAWHNNLYRAYGPSSRGSEEEPKRDVVPYIAFAGYRANYEEPELSEGFSDIKKVNWVFDGTEEERKYWSMWLQIDGK